MLTENYRGITITSVHGMVFEYILLEKTTIAKDGQSNMQFGFTEGLSPNMAALILSEVCSNITAKDILFITTLDSQKAFDVVNHQILMDKLYHLGVNLEFWDVIVDLYQGLTSTVKWNGDTSLSFSINQGVRQGGVISTHLYKQYLNELLNDLENHNIGISIGNTYAGCPTCADDIVLLSLNNNEMQEMLDIVLDYAGDHRFQIHPVKSNAIIKTVGKRKIDRVAEKQNELKLGDNTLHFKTETPHLGLTRSSSDENIINIEERMALARRTLYSLIKTGVHGTNGLNPRTSCKIYQVYVIPRLLYGLETLNLKKKDMATLSSFHIGTLKRLQSLPIRTANSAVYLLLGTLPISAELHKKQLSLLHQIAMSENVSIREIAWRQYNVGRPASFFIRIVGILDLYKLPPFTEVMNGHFKKIDWKGIVKRSINTYWNTKLQLDCQSKSSLSLLITTSLEIGKTHIVWDSINNSVRDVRQAITKARMLTGTYMLQTLKSKFNQSEVDPTCPICRLETETITHVITSCPLYNEIRKEHFVKIKANVITAIGSDSWKRNFNKKDIICQLVIDCQKLVDTGLLPKNDDLIYDIETASKVLCHAIHTRRLNFNCAE